MSPGRFRTPSLALAAGSAAACLLLAATSVQAAGPAPGVYKQAHTAKLGDGVRHFKMVRRGPSEVVHVARVSPNSPYVLRAVPSSGSASGGLERVSSICKRVSCLAAVNGDFWTPTTGRPIGGVISLGQLLTNPGHHHKQLVVSPSGAVSASALTFSGMLVPTDLRPIQVAGVNRPLTPGGVVLYTSAWGKWSGARAPAVELVVQVVRPAGELRLGRTTLVKIVKMRRHGGKVPRNGAVLAGLGAGAQVLAELWNQISKHGADPDALLRINSKPAAEESIGGSPVLVRDGKRVFDDAPTNFVRARHPRTIVGRTKTGEVLLVTVDGRQPGHSDGMSLAEAAQLMQKLGAVEALNLDGGGSTTFVHKGAVINQPSDRAVVRRGRPVVARSPRSGDRVVGLVERPVAVALALVPRTKAAAATKIDVLDKIPPAVQAPVAAPYAADPASDPTGELPVVVVKATRSNALLAGLAGLFVLGAMIGMLAFDRGLRRRVGLALAR